MMKKLPKYLLHFAVFTVIIWGGFFFTTSDAFAVTCTSAGTGNWNNTGTWTGCTGGNGTPANTPGPADTAVITTTHNVTVTADVTVSALTFGSAATAGVLTVDSGVTITVTNALTLQSNNAANTAATIQNGTGQGTIVVGSVQIGDATGPTGARTAILTSTITAFTNNGAFSTTCGDGTGSRAIDPRFHLNSGVVSIAGVISLCVVDAGEASFLMNQGTQGGSLWLSNANPWSITSGAVTTLNGTFATVRYSGASPAVLVTPYTNLTVNGSGTASGVVTSVSGSLVIDGSVTWTTSAITTTISSLQTAGTAVFTTGANTSVGNVIIGSGTTFTMCASCTLAVSGTTSITGTFANPNLAATKTFTGAVTINSGGSITNAGNSAFIFQGGFQNDSSGTVSFGTGAVTFNTNSQNVAGSQAITFGGTVTITGTIIVTNTNTSTVTITSTLDGSVSGSTWRQGTGSYVNLVRNGSVFPTAGTLDASTNPSNTVEYSGGSSTVINNVTYGNLTISGSLSTGTQTCTVGGTFSVTGTFTPTGGTMTLSNSSSISNAGTLTFNNLTVSGTTTTTASFSINGTLSLGASGNLSPSNGTITMATTGWSISNSGTLVFNSLTISETPTAQSSASYSVAGVLTVSGTKTLAPGGGTITLTNGSTIANSGTLTFSGLAIASSATVSITTGTFTVGGTFTANAGSTVNWNNTSDVSVLGGVTYVNLGVGRSADATAVNYTLGGDITVSGVLTIGHASSTAADTFSGSNRTITLSGTGGTPFVITPTWGSFSAGTSDMRFTGNNGSGATTIPVATYATLTFNNGSETFELAGDITAAVLTITAGIVSTSVNDPDITVSSGTNGLTVDGTLSGSGTGTIQVNGQSPFVGSGTVNLSAGTVEMRGNGLTNILFGANSGSNNWIFNNLTFSNAHASQPQSYRTSGTGTGQIIVNGTFQIGIGSDAQNTTLDNETNDRILDVNGSVDITTKGVLQASSTTACTVAGNWTNSGTFTANNGTVTFNGASQTFIGNSTFYGLAITGSTARTVTFTGASTTSVTDNGSLTLTGSDTQLLTLQSSNGSDWNLQVSETGTTVTVSYVSVSKSNASGYKEIVATDGTNTNGGGNTNWLFTVGGEMSTEINGGFEIIGGTEIQ